MVRWLVPATACLLLAFGTLNQHGISSGSAYQPAGAAITNSETPPLYLADNGGSVRNNLSPVTFEWTNRSGFTSSVGSFSPGKVN